MIRIITVDNHPVVCEGIKHLARQYAGLAVVAEVHDTAAAVRVIKNTTSDLILLEVKSRGTPGLGTLRDIKAEVPKVPILIFTALPEEEYAIDCLRAGASGYLIKDCAPEILAGAIRKVAGGGRYISEWTALKLVRGVKEDDPQSVLSPREYEVMKMIAAGKKSSQVAAELCLSVKTISTYRSRTLEKLGLRTNGELMRYAMRRNLL
jgi:DNA-binding NarL/FixJ family response regulator